MNIKLRLTFTLYDFLVAFLRGIIQNLAFYSQQYTFEVNSLCICCCTKHLKFTFNFIHTHSTGTRPFACDQCDKSYAESSTLSQHKKFIHQQIRSFGCQQCDKRFVSARDLKNHSRIHTSNGIYNNSLYLL